MSLRPPLALLTAAIAACAPTDAPTSPATTASTPDAMRLLFLTTLVFAGCQLDVARLDTPPVGDLGFSMHPLGGDDHEGAFIEDGVPYVDAALVAEALGAPDLADATDDRERDGRRYLAPDAVRQVGDAFVWHQPSDVRVRVFPADVLAGVIADSELGRAAHTAGFEVFTGNPY